MNFSKEKAQAYLKKKDEQNNSSAVNYDNVSFAVNSDNVSFNAEKARAYLSDNEGKPVRQYTVRFDTSDTGASDSGYSPRMKESYDSFLSGREKSKPMPEAVKSQIGDLQKQIDALTGKISFAQENYDTVGAKSLLEQQRQLQTELYQLQADNAESEYDRYMAQYKLHNQSFRKLLDGDGSDATSEDYRNFLKNDKMAVSAKDNAEMIDYITKYADKERKDNFGGQFAANYDVGKINEDSAIAWDEYLDDPTEENRRKAEALSVAAQEYQAKNAAALDDENSVLPWITKSLANYLPQFVNQQAMQIPLGIITAVATLNPANYKYGATVGSGVYSYRTMRGTAFRSLVEAGVPEEKARAAANDEAVISSMIEMGETFLSLSAFGMNKLSGGAVGNAGAKIAGALESKLPSSAARALFKVGKALAAYGINILSESQEERSQEAVSIANENRDYTQDTGIGDLAYAALKKYIGGFTGSGATEEEIARMKESEAEGAKLAAMLGGVETAQAAILNGKLNSSAKRYTSDVNSMIEEGMESPEGTKSRKYAEEARKKVDSGKTLPGYQIRELAEANAESILSQDVGKITKAVEKQLTDRGYEGHNTEKLAAAIAKTVAGQDTTIEERKSIRNSEQAKQILQEIAGASDVVQKYAESGAAYQAAEQNAELAGEQLEQAQNDVSMQTDFKTAADNLQKADEKRTAAKEAFDAAQNEYENGSTAWARQIGARIVGDGVLSENSVEGYAHLFGKHAKLFIEAHEDGQDARQYTIEFAKAYNEGTKGGNLQALIDSGSLQNLSTVQINAAYQAGLDARNSLNTRRDTDGLHLRQSSIWENGANSTAYVQEVEANAEQDQKRNADSGRKTAAEKAAGFTAEKAYRRVTTLEELGVKDAKAGIKVTQVSSDYSDETAKAYEMCAQNGVQCVFFTGGYLQTKDGIIARGANNGGVVYIRADDPNFTANEIAGHEIGHELVNRGSLDMNAVISEVRKEYTKEELSKIVDDYGLDFLADGVNEDELTDMIIEEITCDALGGMNAFASNREGNAEFVQKLQGLAEKHYTGKTGEGTFARQRGAEQKLSAVNDALESRLSDSTRKDLEKSGLTVQDGVVVADNLAKQMREEGYEKPVDVFDIGEKFSVVTEPEWRKSFLKNGGNADVAELMRTFTENMVANDAIASIVPMGQYSKSKFGPLRANVEYMFSFDMDTSCPRTFQFINYRDRLQKMVGRPLTFNESINLMNIMKLMGQQIPCTYCYVENKRAAKSAAYLNYFAARDAVMSSKTRQEALTKMYSYDAKKGTVSAAAQKVFDQWWEDVENGSAFHPDATTAWTAWSDSRNAVFNYLDALKESGAVNLTGAGRKTSRKALQNMALRQFGIKEKIGNSTNPAANEIINFVQEWEYDTKAGVEHKYFTENSADASVQEDMLTVHRLANNYSSSATSAKTVENYTPYVDQLKAISPELKKYMMGMGGIRKHSSNDFRIDYVQDYFLFYADLARDGWTGHTYTKSIDFCKIFGRCGDRINLSIAFDTDTENGKIIENDQEGAPHREARKIRGAYENVGVMAMVTDNAQLSYVLNSDWIDMCIPFHASGLPKAIWYNMKAWCDYTTKQLESFLTTDEMRQALIDEKVDIPAKATKDDIAKLYNSTFGIKQILSKAGTPVRPHFFPNDTIVNGQLVPGHHNNVEEYFRLCREYGVHPRFYSLQVTDKSGKLIPVTEHPGYVKLIKETARTDTEQKPIQFNFNEVDPYLGMSPMDYAMQEMEAFGKINGYETNKQDPMGIVPKFAKDYLGKDRPAGYVSPTFKRDIAVVSKLDAHHEMYDADMEAFYSFRPTDNTKENEHRNGAEQKFSTVNSTQLALENPDVYDEIQVTFDEILQKTKGKDLEAALMEEAQKHQEDRQLWEHEAAVLTKLWKQNDRDYQKVRKALDRKRKRIKTEIDSMNSNPGMYTDIRILEQVAEETIEANLSAAEIGALSNFKRYLKDAKKFQKIIDDINENGGANTIQDRNRVKLAQQKIDEITPKLWTIANNRRLQDLIGRTREALIQKYGTIPEGENASRESNIPMQTSETTKVSRTARTAVEASGTTDEMAEKITEKVVEGGFSYVPISDDGAKRLAEETIKRNGFNDAALDWFKTMGKTDNPGKNEIAMGWTLYNNAVNAGDTKTAMKILTEITTTVRNAAQTVQANRILKQLSPENRLYAIRKQLDALQQDLDSRYGDKAPQIDMNSTLVLNYLSARGDKDIRSAEKALYQNIASQLPNTFLDKWNSWRYLSMLGNMRTHIRNIAGNVGFVPVRATKDTIAALIESGVNSISKDGIERTKGILIGAKDRGLYNAGADDFKTVSDLMENATTKSSDTLSQIERMKPAFGGNSAVWRVLSKAAEANSWALGAEDMVFKKITYAAAFGGYLKAHDVTESMYRNGELSDNFMDQARAYAMEEALKATYNDCNAFSDFVARVGKLRYSNNIAEKIAGRIVEGVLPFKRTPANILARSVEYSPIGLMNGIKKCIYDVRNGKSTASEAIDALASGLTGTLLLGLGYFLANLGLIKGGEDDDKKQSKFDKLRGDQSYSLVIGDKSYTIDWLAPEVIPMFVGAEIQRFNNDGNIGIGTVLDALSRVTEPLLEMSMLSGLNDMLDNISYSDKKLYSIISTAAASYVMQGLPTIMGQLERTGETVRETTYVDKESDIPKDMQYTIAKAANKIPGIEYNQIPYIDAYGRQQKTGNVATRAFSNFLSPGYIGSDRSAPWDDELQKLYDAGQTNVFPVMPDDTDIKGYVMDGDELVKFRTAAGEKKYELLEDLFDSVWFNRLPDEDKADCISKVYSYANAYGKKQIVKTFESSTTNEAIHKHLINGGSIVSYFKNKMDKK